MADGWSSDDDLSGRFSLSSAAAASAARAGLVCSVDMPLGSLLSMELLLAGEREGGGEGEVNVRGGEREKTRRELVRFILLNLSHRECHVMEVVHWFK